MNKIFFINVDWGIMIPVIVLVTLSLTTLWSLDTSLFKNQLFFLIISFTAFLFFSQFNYVAAKNYSLPIYIAAIVTLTIILIIGIESRGSVRWIELFGIRIQFSEIFKPLLAISFSAFLVSRQINYSLKEIFRLSFFLIPIAFLIFLQPDLGNALIYVGTFILTLIIYGFPFRFFLVALVSLFLMTPVFWKFLHGYQKQRIITFFHPTDVLSFSYNAIQSVIAVGAGMFMGRGLGLGTQSGLRFLPERHTDFIFATLSEELGFVGTVTIILSFAFILYRIFVIFSNSEDSFCKTFSIVAFSLIFLQFLINIGMNIGIVPIVGVTLPFVSYGGSSLLSNFILLGFLSAINRKSKSLNVLEIK